MICYCLQTTIFSSSSFNRDELSELIPAHLYCKLIHTQKRINLVFIESIFVPCFVSWVERYAPNSNSIVYDILSLDITKGAYSVRYSVGMMILVLSTGTI